MACLPGLNYGTGGAKAAVVDDSGDLQGYAFEEYPLEEHPILTPKAGGPAPCNLINEEAALVPPGSEGLKSNRPIILSEGGVKSTLWRKIITNVFSVQTTMVENRAGAPCGDAILAGVATGILPDFSIAREKARYVNHQEPDVETHALYQEYLLSTKIFTPVSGMITGSRRN